MSEKNSVFSKRTKTVIAFFAVAIVWVIYVANHRRVDEWLSFVLYLFRPLIIGAALAYIGNPVFRFFERKVFYKMRSGTARRWVSISVTYLTFLLLLFLLLLSILPQLIESIKTFSDKFDFYFESAVSALNSFFDGINNWMIRFNHKAKTIPMINAADLQENIMKTFFSKDEGASGILSNLGVDSWMEKVKEVLAWTADIIFSVMVCTYLLATKEKRYAQVMKFRRAFFSEKANVRITRACTIADRSFGGFLEGKILDSLIIGALTYVMLLIFRIPYPLLIAAFVGVTNVIPFIGPIIGAVPTGLIVLLEEPAKTIPFIILIVIIQQLDGNIIGPKILGENTGVSPLCVIVSITVMGTAFGFIGMIIAVPLFAMILELSDYFFADRLQKKGLPSSVESYYSPTAILSPAQKSFEGTDKMVQKLEYSFLKLSKRQVTHPEIPLSKKELATIKLYDTLLKLHLISPASQETLIRFSAKSEMEEMIQAHTSDPATANAGKETL